MYKILSSYSILKPPKYGNCSVNGETKIPLISLSDIKSIYHKPKEKNNSFLALLKSRFNEVITMDDWNIYDIFETEHDYATPETYDCIIYYITGRVAQQLLKFTTCYTCKNALLSLYDSTDSTYYDRKTFIGDMLYNSFSYPKHAFYMFIRNLESIFLKYCDKANVAEEVLSNAIECNILSFPCQEHKSDIISYIIYYFLQIRMSKYCRNLNNNTKDNLHKKKIAKHSKT